MDPQLLLLLQQYLQAGGQDPTGGATTPEVKPDANASPYSDAYQAYAKSGSTPTEAAPSGATQTGDTLSKSGDAIKTWIPATGLGLTAVGDVVGAVGQYQDADAQAELARKALIHQYAQEADQQSQSDQTSMQNRLAQLWQLRGGR